MSKIISVLPSQDHYVFHTDPGHGWLEVSRKELNELGLKDKISAYSYQKGDSVYLEEDQDATYFIDAWVEKHGEPLPYREYDKDPTPIRNYQRYVPQD